MFAGLKLLILLSITQIINARPVELESRGIADVLNPQNLANATNLVPGNLLPTISNPFNQTQDLNNRLKDVKLFFETRQGMVMPASVLTGGFTSFLGSLSSMGNFFGNLATLNPVSGG